MNGGPNPDLTANLDIFKSEIVRWNTQINLVTRVDTRRNLDMLVGQCRDAWSFVRDAVGGETGFGACLYADLGSGNGLPGLVWACARNAEGHRGSTVLVEPRDKRAWFLQRTARRLGLSEVAVHAARWGETELPDGLAGASRLLVSLKALRLTDAQVVEGLSRSPGVDRDLETLTILRFLEPQAPSLEELEDEYAICVPGSSRRWTLERSEILGSRTPRLLLTSYRR